MSELAQIVSTVGFPIVMCGFFCWYMNTTLKEMTEVITRNTIALEKILYKLGGESDEQNSKDD